MSDNNVMHNAPNTSGANSFLTKWSGVIIWGFFVVLLLVFVSLVVLAMQEEPQAAEVGFDRQNASVLAALSPQVAIKTPQDGDFRSINETQPVTTGTEIRTNPGGQAVLFSGDGTRTVLDENTTVRLDSVDNENDQSRLALVAGSLWAQVDNALTGDESYEVQSANVVTSVRGTEFNITKEEEGGLSITTLQDEVTVEPAESEESTSTVAVLSGENAEIPTTSSANLATLGTNNLSADQIREVILDNAQTEERISNPELQEVQAIMNGIPTLAASEDRQESSSLERLGEAVHSSFFTDSEVGQVRDNVLRAQERLQEARANADNPNKLEGIIQNYRQLARKITEQAIQSDNPDVKRLVVNATRQHQSVLTDLMNQTSDLARRIVRDARMTAKDRHRELLNEMASSSPRIAYQEGVRSMKTQLRSVLRDAAFNNNLDIRDSIGDYDQLMQINAKASNVSGSSTQANLADGLRKNLAVVNTVEKFESSLAPGIRRAVDESEDRISDTQLAAIASIATSSPEQAVEIYEKTANQYLEQINEAESSEEAEENAAGYNKYASFAERVSQTASEESDGTSTVQEKFKEAADKQLEKLTQAQERVPESAQNVIQEAIERQRQARNPDELPSQAEGQGPPADVGPDQDGLPDEAEGQGSDTDPSERGNQGQGPDVDPSEQGPPTDAGSGEGELPDEAQGQGPDIDPSERGNQGPDADPSERGDQGQGPDVDPSEGGDQGPIENPSENAGQGPGQNPSENGNQGPVENPSDQNNDLDDYLNEVKERSPKGEMQSLQNQNADESQQQGNNGNNAAGSNQDQSNQQSQNSQQSADDTGQSDSGNASDQQQGNNENDSAGSSENQSNQQSQNTDQSSSDSGQSDTTGASNQQEGNTVNGNDSSSETGVSDETQGNQGSTDQGAETNPTDDTTSQSPTQTDNSDTTDQLQQEQQSNSSTGENTLDEQSGETPVNNNGGNNNSPNNNDDTEQSASVFWWLNPF